MWGGRPGEGADAHKRKDSSLPAQSLASMLLLASGSASPAREGDGGAPDAPGTGPTVPEPNPIIVRDSATGEEKDVIVDFGVGEGHVIVLAETGEVYVMGRNGNGQLGLGIAAGDVVKNWRRVDLGFGLDDKGSRVVGVAAGPRCSFIMVEEEEEQGK